MRAQRKRAVPTASGLVNIPFFMMVRAALLLPLLLSNVAAQDDINTVQRSLQAEGELAHVKHPALTGNAHSLMRETTRALRRHSYNTPSYYVNTCHCPNGAAKLGSNDPDITGCPCPNCTSCTSCNYGYTLQQITSGYSYGENECVATVSDTTPPPHHPTTPPHHHHYPTPSYHVNTCSCPLYGYAATGDACRRDGAVMCSSCENGYTLNENVFDSYGNQETHCVPVNKCTCPNGVAELYSDVQPASGCPCMHCLSCTMCDFGYTLQYVTEGKGLSWQWQKKECVATVSNTTPPPV
jgi:hypothetical protein